MNQLCNGIQATKHVKLRRCFELPIAAAVVNLERILLMLIKQHIHEVTNQHDSESTMT